MIEEQGPYFMPATSIQHVEQMAFDGPIGTALAVTIAISCAAFFAWMLWRETGVIGSRRAILFWLLRTTAVGVILWMLLAPARVQISTSTTRRAIAIVTDLSDSMGIVDPAGSSDDFRWALAAQNDGPEHALTAMDRATTALAIAQQRLSAATEAVRRHRPETTVVQTLAETYAALQSTRSQLEIVDQHTTSSKTQALGYRVTQLLNGPEFDDFARLMTALEKGRGPSRRGWRESLPDLLHRVTTLQEACRELSVAVMEEDATRHPTLAPSIVAATRAQRVVDVAKQLEASVLASLPAETDIRFQIFHSELTAIPNARSFGSLPSQTARDASAANAPVRNTNLSAVFEELQREFQDQPLAGVFVLSDFAHNQAGAASPTEVAATLSGTPVYTIPVGNPRHVRDLELQSVFAPAVAMRNDDIVLEARIQAYDCAGEVCSLQLLRDDQVLAQRELHIDTDFLTRTVRFEEHVSTVGLQHYQVRLTPITDELTTENNTREVDVNVTRNDLKILIADEFPRWEYRYLTQLFRRDSKMVCDELLFHPRLIATGQREASRTLPVTAEDWDDYDLVILGDLPTDHFPVAAQEALAEYLQTRGGTVVMIAGEAALPEAYAQLPLGELIPVTRTDENDGANTQGFSLALTAEGRDHPAVMIADTVDDSRVAWDFVNRYSPIPHVSPWRQPRPTAHTLLEAVPRNRPDDGSAATSAFLCWQPVGRGRVVYLSGPESYRLRLLRGDRLHYRFWGQLIRWAIASDLGVGSQFVQLRTDKTRYGARESVQVVLHLTDTTGQPIVATDLSARVSHADGDRQVPLTANPQIPGEYHGEISGLGGGSHQIEPIGDAVQKLLSETDHAPVSVTIHMQPELSTELVETRCDRVLAEQIAKATGGLVLPPTAVAEVLALTNLEPIVEETAVRQPLWVQWKYLWIVFGCLHVEWVIRKWLGVS